MTRDMITLYMALSLVKSNCTKLDLLGTSTFGKKKTKLV